MYMGVILPLRLQLVMSASIPHVSGGDPLVLEIHYPLTRVFPMYVGVIPK